MIIIMNRKSDPFWTVNYEILYKSDRLSEFMPTSEMSLNEKLNAITRFGIYSGLLLALLKNKFWPLYVSVFVMLLTVFINQNSDNLNLEGFGFLDLIGRQLPGFEGTDLDQIRKKRLDDLGKEQQIVENENGEFCTPPSDQNPFMNLLVNEYGTNRPPACDTDYDEEIQKDIDQKFNINLYKDVSEVFGNINSQRQFYTNPVTTSIPDPNGDFKNWLYGNMASCKDDRYDCHPDIEDLRANPFIFPDPDQNPN